MHNPPKSEMRYLDSLTMQYGQLTYTPASAEARSLARGSSYHSNVSGVKQVNDLQVIDKGALISSRYYIDGLVKRLTFFLSVAEA